jgi:hypothetical protein
MKNDSNSSETGSTSSDSTDSTEIIDRKSVSPLKIFYVPNIFQRSSSEASAQPQEEKAEGNKEEKAKETHTVGAIAEKGESSEIKQVFIWSFVAVTKEE